MENTIKTFKTKSNKLINGETINYTISFLLSFISVICIKQIFKTFFAVNTQISVLIGFIAGEIILYLTERYFVFKDEGINSTAKQFLISVLNCLLHFGIYKLFDLIICKLLNGYSYSAWFATGVFVFILNYAVARVFVFDCLSSAENKKNGRIYKIFFDNRYSFLSMLGALICLLFFYILFSVFPFGDTTVLRMDLYHQYGPLFTELFDRIVERKSFIYSFTSGGGSSFLGNYFNYLSSPLSVLIFLFDRIQMPFAISFLVGLKCILSSGSFSYYLRKSQKINNVFISVFGLFYAFCAYFLAYFWNIMWLDALVLFPFAVLGIEKIINEGKPKLYIISLALMLFCNYYMGYMACIFAVIYFVAYYFMDNSLSSKIEAKNTKNKILCNKFINRGIYFALSSLCVGMICAFFLVPVYFILTSSSATSGTFPKTFESYFGIFDFIKNHFALLETTIRSSGDDVLPNVYCGVLTLILVPLFVINKNIKTKEKGIYILLLLFFLFCFDNNIANYIWHALHFPNDLPYRFSYMYSFLLLVISCKTINNIKAISIKDIGFVSMAWIALIVIAQETATSKMSDYTIYATIAFIIIWCAFFFAYTRKKINKLIIGTVVVAITFCEIIVCDTKALGLSQKLSDYTVNYPAYTECVNYIEDNDDSLYKTELSELNTRMDPCLYGYNGISVFSSMANENYSGLQYSLGMYGNRINSYTYNTQTPVYNMMYNMKYIIYTGENTRPSTNLYTKYYECSNGKSVVFTNDYFLPISYCVNENINEWNTEEGNPFDVQSNWFKLSTGFSDVFKEVNYINCTHDGVIGNDVTSNGEYQYSGNSNTGSIDITIKPNINGNVYLYVSSREIKNLSCTSNDDSITQSIETPYILDLGYKTVDEEITISLDCTNLDNASGNYDIYCYSADDTVLKAGYKLLNSQSINITDFSETEITGTIKAKSNCVLYSSIPYDEGWTITVDGEKAETFAIGNSQLGIMLKPGIHEIKYKYSPKGLTIGCGISAVTILTLSGLFVLKRKKRTSSNKV